MAEIPNQKNITKIIKSQADNLDTVINVIVKASTSKTVNLANKRVAEIKKYKSTLSDLFDPKEGIVMMITNATDKLIKLNTQKLPDYRIISKMTQKMLKYVNSIADTDINVDKLKEVKEKLTPVIEIIESITGVFDNIAKMKIPGMFTMKFFMIKLGLWRISKLSLFLNLLNLMTPIMLTSKASLILLDSITHSIFKIFNNISNTKIGLFTVIKIRLIAFLLRKTAKIIKVVSLIGRYIRHVGGLKDALILATVFNMLESVFASLKAIKVGLFFRIKLNRITRALLLINKITRIMSHIRIRTKAFVSLLMLRMLFINFALLCTVIILITPIVVLSMPALVLLLLFSWAFAFIIRRIVRIFIRLAHRVVLKGLLALMLISSMLAMTALMFLIVAMVAEPVVKSGLWILGLLGIIIVVSTLLAILGIFVGTILFPVLPVIAIGLGAILLMVGTIFLLALMLKVIQQIDLDKEKIMENVGIVIGVTLSIISEIFKPDETNNEGSKKSWIASIIEFIGGTLKTVIQAIMAASFLAVMVVAVLMILLMATQLRLLQELNLDEPKIKENVNLVINTCLNIIDLLFNTPTKDSKEGNKTWLQSLLDYMGSGLVMIIKAIMAVAFLMFSTIAISLILLMATQLRLLQELNLDDTLINENVKTVINTCVDIINQLFNREDIQSNKSDKGFLLSVINYISPDLAMVFEAIMAVAFLALSVFVILMIVLIATQLRILQTIELKPELILKNLAMVLDTAQLVIEALYRKKDEPDKPSKKGWIRSLIDFVGLDGIAKVIDAILAIAWLGMTVAVIALIHLLTKQLKEIGEITIANNITDKVEKICDAADKVKNYLTERSVKKDDAEDSNKSGLIKHFFPKLSNIAGAISRMKWVASVMSSVGVVHEIVKTLTEINKLEDPSTAVNKVKNICDSADRIATLINDRIGVDVDEKYNKLEFLHRINKVIKELGDVNDGKITKSEKAINAHANFIEKIHNLDVTKLDTAAKLFEHIADFSKSIRGDFEGLATAIMEEIGPSLVKIEELLNDVNMALDRTSNTINLATSKQAKATAELQQSLTGVGSTDSDYTARAEEKAKLDGETEGTLTYATKVEEYKNQFEKDDELQRNNNHLAKKLDNLYDLLCGNGMGGTQFAIVRINNN